MKPRFTLPRLLPLAALCGALTAALAPDAFAQSTSLTWAQSYGVGSYDKNGTADPNNSTSGEDKPTGIAAMPDGGFVVAGEIALPALWQTGAGGGSGHPCAGLVRFAPDGTILWQKAFRQDNDQYSDAYGGQYDFRNAHISQVLTDAQGNIFLNMVREAAGVVSDVNVGEGVDHSATIARFSADGTLVWTFAYDGDAYDYNNGNGTTYHFNHGIGSYASISLTADGGVVACGGEGGSEGNFSQPFFLKVKADGTLGMTRSFAPSAQGEYAGAAAQSADGKYYLMAANKDGDMVVTDAAGTVVAQRSFGDDSSSYDIPARAIANADGTFTVLSYGILVQGAYNFGVNNIVRKLRPDLTSVWETVLRDGNPGVNLTPTSDGGYLLTTNGSANDLLGGDRGSTKGDAAVVRLNADGTLASSFLLGGTDDEGIPVVAQTTDGGYALATASYSYHLTDPINHPDWWVVKADRAGRVQHFGGIMYPVNHYFDVHANTTASTPSTLYNQPPGANTGPGGYAINGAPQLVILNLATIGGVNQPTASFQATPDISDNHPAFFAGEAALSNGVYYLAFPDNANNVLGYYSYLSDPHYIYHFDLGYEYVFDAADGHGGVYLYDFKSNDFFYTSPVFAFPYLYDFGLNTVLYYYPDPDHAGHYNTNGYRFFYRFDNGQIIVK